MVKGRGDWPLPGLTGPGGAFPIQEPSFLFHTERKISETFLAFNASHDIAIIVNLHPER
jgi:hypothetical protein